ncbi:hypothetical protein Bbelb_244020 [Branchiostoma belcheri]|nr:hypothetical protein Bbelb_244020 [Branchiostoma belcheri]
MDGNRYPRPLAIGSIYDQAEPVNPIRARNAIRLVETRQHTGDSEYCAGWHQYSVPQPVRLPPRRLREATTESECSQGRQEGVYEEAEAVVLQPAVGEASLEQGTDGREDRTQAQKGVPQLQDGDKQLACCWMKSLSRLICATVALTTLVVIVTTLVTTETVGMTTVFPSYQTQTPSQPSWTTETLSRNTTRTSATSGKTSAGAHAMMPRTTAMTEQGTPRRFRAGWVPIYTDEDVKAAEETTMFGRQGSGPGEFQNPRGVAVSADNEILVADTFNRRVQVFDMQGAFLRLFPAATPEGRMVAPEDVCVAGDGSLWIVGKHASGTVAVRYVTLGVYRRYQLTRPMGLDLLAEWLERRHVDWCPGFGRGFEPRHGTSGFLSVSTRSSSGSGKEYTSDGSPREQIPLRRTAFSRGIAVNPKTSRVVVTETDGRGGEVLMFRPDGTKDQRYKVQQGFIGFGRREGMMHPWFVATDTEGNILVSDYSTKYVYMYNQSGGFLAKFGGHFRYPAGLCADGGGNIAVADSGSRRVEVVTGRGRHVRYAAEGRGKPSGVALGPAGQMVVTYGLKNVVAIFTLKDRKA